MTIELDKTYKPAEVEGDIFRRWVEADAFHADPGDTLQHGKPPYCIVIPPPNVTAALHIGHALNNTLQDILIRWRRMAGDNAVWIPGTDHAGIATQTVVEKRVLAEQGKRRTDFGREEFVKLVQAWKDEYEGTIIGQLKAMGCSCDWARQRFTMDEMCARAVREAFFRMFKDGLIYRGKRLVNWDPVTQTALADDEVEMEEVDGHFYYLRYPLTAPLPDGTNHITVATTRPETMLGDTAVAVNPKDPRAAELRGRQVLLPIVNRVIPIIEDDYVVMPAPGSGDAKAEYATGFLKVTPAHDENDWLIGQRHNLPVINVFSPDAKISKDHGWPVEDWTAERSGGNTNDAEFLLGLDRFEARKKVVAWFKDFNMYAGDRPYRHSVGHSYRSHVPIEPYLSDQWYVATKSQIKSLLDEENVKDTNIPKNSLAGLALRAMETEGKSKEGSTWEGGLRITPDRYARTYQAWHENIRDWCVSRQLWWGHRIPVWRVEFFSGPLSGPIDPEESWKNAASKLQTHLDEYARARGLPSSYVVQVFGEESRISCHICSASAASDSALRELVAALSNYGPYTPDAPMNDVGGPYPIPFGEPGHESFRAIRHLVRDAVEDPDVLDTWFSSALWPMSTMGWPEETAELKVWNPSQTLSTAREIITLWVSRMVMFNLYFRGTLPFKDVFIHAMIQDGQGRKMSKSLGNGVDPLDIIHSHGSDAMRFTLAKMTTDTQDIRLPVVKDPATGRNTSEKFDDGRNFANKIWNAVRFAMTNLEGSHQGVEPSSHQDAVAAGFSLADRWMLSRLARVVKSTSASLGSFQFSGYAQGLYDFIWRDLCDWYIEAVKPTVKENPSQRKVLALVLDATLRLLHPVMPFVTEKLWEKLNEVAPHREISGVALTPSALLISAAWPVVNEGLIDPVAEAEFDLVREVVGAIREVRTTYKVPPRQKVEISAKAPAAIAQRLLPNRDLIQTLANVVCGEIGPRVDKPADAASTVVVGTEHYVHGLIVADAEKARLAKRLEEVTKSVATLEARLENKSYTERAPANLVQQTKDQLATARHEADTLRQQIESLR